jgi:hypothetical protein
MIDSSKFPFINSASSVGGFTFQMAGSADPQDGQQIAASNMWRIVEGS